MKIDSIRDPIETATPEAWTTYQNELTRRAVTFAATHTQEVAGRLSGAGITAEEIRSTDDLQRIPVLSKDDLPALQAASPPFGGMLAVPLTQLRRIFLSPGPILDPEADVADFWRWEAGIWAAGFRPDDVVYNTFAYHLTPAGAMMEEGLRAVGCTVVPGGVGNSDWQADFLVRSGATAYTGTPDFLHTLLELMASKNLVHKLRRAFVSGGPLLPALRTVLEEQHGLEVYQGYGTADAGAIGFECSEVCGWHIAPGIVVEIVDPASGEPLSAGETGEVVVTLPSDVYPLVRLGIGDLSALEPAACACGRSTPRLLGWQGRVGDGVKVRGMFVHGRQLAAVLSGWEGVERFQAEVSHDERHKDCLTIRVVATAIDREELSAALKQALKVRAEVEVVAEIADDAKPLVDSRNWD
jgi:phenylacetate-CoA ligase